jgi:hypothetical protein
MYSTYEFYTDTYKGTLDSEAYNRLAVRAFAEINRITFNRAGSAMGAELEAVKMAECAVIDELDHIAMGGDITSESNDGVSRSYASSGIIKSITQRITAAAEIWLNSTNLCFAGV